MTGYLTLNCCYVEVGGDFMFLLASTISYPSRMYREDVTFVFHYTKRSDIKAY